MAERVVHHGDGIAFLERGPLAADHAIVTSLPDHSELPDLGVDGWRRWFVDTVGLACRSVADDAVAIFYQTDVKHDGRWIDKGHLVQCGADTAGSSLLWHKIVCRVPPGTTTFGRPAYAHLIAVSRTRRLAPGASTPDVLPALGTMTWSRAMGAAACEAAIKFVASIGARVVVDPFCGLGSALAAANAHGLDAIGVELSRRRAAGARKAIHANG
ncbi:MAG: SAM-dependent methyltransferase [Deltaproteobacteria bacterium]|nr:SAM-dependent methyltransferase [Deltaproteobacteria bacterium]MDQ3298744.1 site-specific DNA-methyltransferase [Myxococcota bacterium]